MSRASVPSGMSRLSCAAEKSTSAVIVTSHTPSSRTLTAASSDGSAASAASALRLNASAQKTARKKSPQGNLPILFSFICITITQNREKCNFRAKIGGLPLISEYGIISLSKSPFGLFRQACFQNCKIEFCIIILQFCRCGGLWNAKGHPDGFLSHYPSLRNFWLGSFLTVWYNDKALQNYIRLHQITSFTEEQHG